MLTIEQVVKVPAGLQSQDLARPVLQVTSFLSKKALYEIYSFGEQIVVMDLDKIQSAG
jgi:ATPase